MVTLFLQKTHISLPLFPCKTRPICQLNQSTWSFQTASSTFFIQCDWSSLQVLFALLHTVLEVRKLQCFSHIFTGIANSNHIPEMTNRLQIRREGSNWKMVNFWSKAPNYSLKIALWQEVQVTPLCSVSRACTFQVYMTGFCWLRMLVWLWLSHRHRYRPPKPKWAGAAPQFLLTAPAAR